MAIVSDGILADLSLRFLNRWLFKAYDLDMPDDQKARLCRSTPGYRTCGFRTEYYMVEDKAGDVPIILYKDESRPKDQIYVEEGYSRPAIREISEVSAAVRGLQKGYRIHRLCFPGEVKLEIAALYHR